MAHRKILLALGQSNATQEGDALSFEKAAPSLNVRTGDAADTSGTWTMPDTFVGGPMVGMRNDVAHPDGLNYQTFSTAGSAYSNIRYLTFYNPSASYNSVGVSETSDYPGTTKLVTGSNSAELLVEARFNTKARSYSGGLSGSLITGVTASIGDRVMLGSGWGGTSIDTTTLYWVVSTTGGIGISLTEGGTALNPSGSGEVYHVNFGTITRQSDSSTYTAWMDVNTKNKLHVEPEFTSPVEEEKIDFDYQVQAIPAAGELIFNVQSGGFSTGGSVDSRSGAFESVLPGLEPIYAGSRGSQFAGLVVTPGRTLNVNDVVQIGFLANNTNSTLADGTYYVTSVPGKDSQSLLTVQPSGTATITSSLHGLVNRERVTVDQTGGGLTKDKVYMVERVDDNSFRLSGPYLFGTPVGTQLGNVTITSEVTLRRLDIRSMGMISATPGGTALHWSETSSAQNATARINSGPAGAGRFEGSLSGIQLESLSGANATERVNLGNVKLSADSETVVEYSGTFTNAVAVGDTFKMAPPKHNGADVPFDQWAYFLPWSPLEGRSDGSLSFYADVGRAGGVPAQIVYASGYLGTGHQYSGPTHPAMMVWQEDADAPLVNKGDTVVFQENKPLDVINPPTGMNAVLEGCGLTPGVEYEVDDIFQLTSDPSIKTRLRSLGEEDGYRYAFLKRDGEYVEDPSSGAIGTFDLGGLRTLYRISATVVNPERRHNNAPPGFNFPNHYVNQWPYQAYAGDAMCKWGAASSFHVRTAEKLSQHYGEPVYVVAHAIGNTSLETRTTPDPNSLSQNQKHFGWVKWDEYLSWEQSAGTDLYDRLEEVLDATNIALAKQGDTGEIVGIAFAQGEADSTVQSERDAYQANLTAWIPALRSLIDSKGLAPDATTTGEVNVQFDYSAYVHPEIWADNDYHGFLQNGAELNESIQAVTSTTSGAESFSVSDATANPQDQVHYTGNFMVTLGDRVFSSMMTAIASLPKSVTTSADAQAQSKMGAGLAAPNTVSPVESDLPHDKMSGIGPSERSINDQ